MRNDSIFNTEWAFGAGYITLQFALSGIEFSADSVRAVCRSAGVPNPSHPNHWGRLFAYFAQAEVIRAVAVKTSDNPSRNLGLQRVWVGA